MEEFIVPIAVLNLTVLWKILAINHLKTGLNFKTNARLSFYYLITVVKKKRKKTCLEKSLTDRKFIKLLVWLWIPKCYGFREKITPMGKLYCAMHGFCRAYSPRKSIIINKLPMTPMNHFVFILHPPFPTMMRLGVIVNRRVFPHPMTNCGARRAIRFTL